MLHPDLPLVLVEDFLPSHAALLAAERETIAWDERMRARRTASYGRPYDYSQLTYPERPMPPWLDEIRRAVAPIAGFEPDNCLLNEYTSGASTMGLHVDSLDDLAPGTGVAIVSTGSARTLRFVRLVDGKRPRRGDPVEEVGVRLEGGSLLVMPPVVQTEWLHGISAEPEAGLRVIGQAAWRQGAAGFNSRRGVSAAQLGLPGITGKVMVERGQYLHLGIDLVVEDGGKRYRLNEVRRVKTDEVHYFDHPAIGVLAVLSGG